MNKSRSKYEQVYDRAEWMKLSPSDRSSNKGKKMFLIHKNVNSVNFRSVLQNEAENRTKKKSLPPVVKTTKALQITHRRKEAEVQVSSHQISDLQQKLKEKETQIIILKNMFSQATSRLEASPQALPPAKNKRTSSLETSPQLLPPSKNKHTISIIESPSLNPTSPTGNSFARHGSLPSLTPRTYLEYSSHPAFVQPKFTHNHPKLILSNPITGILPPYN